MNPIILLYAGFTNISFAFSVTMTSSSPSASCHFCFSTLNIIIFCLLFEYNIMALNRLVSTIILSKYCLIFLSRSLNVSFVFEYKIFNTATFSSKDNISTICSIKNSSPSVLEMTP